MNVLFKGSQYPQVVWLTWFRW